ncbi:MAG TPA: signal peptidase II, partial [Candidatus Nanoarchaeia archaeon]|nr:signal peptidase II [Candidatus Nanoarchaeia archaeon]
YESLVIIPGVFKLTYIINTGAGFGILQNFNSLLLFISLFVLGTILFYWDTLASVFEKVSMSFIVGGIMGNMIDRIAHGSVIDFLEVPFWPAFNIADTMICIGVLGLLYYEIKYE